MRFVHLEIAHFGCMERAEIPFGPGLNVLFGPNDLGKSTLAHAIRCALLLPDSSSAAQAVVPWSSDRAPRVRLVFQTEPQRFWRVTKEFDPTRGSSVLESSRDGASFSSEHRGRRVDEELRKLLCWGIPPPGKSAPRGLPPSFLSTALLARQGDVDAVLRATLAEDLELSGRQRISHALQALAQDPLVRNVLDQTQEKVDEAFTTKGQLKRGKQGPLPVARDRVARARTELEQSQRRVQESRAVESRVAELADQLRAAEDERLERQVELTELDELLRTGEKRRTAEERCRGAEHALALIADLDAAVTKTESAAGRAASELAASDTALAALGTRAQQAESDLASAREALREAQSESSVLLFSARKNELTTRKLEIDARHAAASALVGRAQRAGRLDLDLAGLRKELDEKQTALARLRERGREVAERETRARAELENVRDLALVSSWLSSKRALADLERTAIEGQRLRAEETRKRMEAQAIEEELLQLALPGGEHLEAMRQLRQEIELQEAATRVGLSVEIRPARSIDLQVRRDGRDDRASTTAEPVTLEADRDMTIAIPGVAEIVVRGGTRVARDEEHALHGRWASEVAPVLQRCGAEDLANLTRACKAADARREQVRELTRQADVLRARLDAMGDVASSLEQRRCEVAERATASAGRDVEHLTARAAVFGDGLAGQLDGLRAEAERGLDAAREQTEAARFEIAQADARAGELTRNCEVCAAELAAAVAELGSDWTAALRAAEQDAARLAEERSALIREMGDLDNASTTTLARGQERVHAAGTAFADAREHHAAAQRARDEKLEAVATLRAQLDERRQAAARADRPAAEAALADAQNALAAVPAPSKPVTADDVEQARTRLLRAGQAVGQLKTNHNVATGQLQQVGGLIADEELDQAQIAYDQAEYRHRELEADYEAWRLLLITLREAEDQQASHLGKALAGPVAARFREVAGSRYPDVALGSELQTEGVVSAGRPREPGLLSVGTREQLATLLRLSLAEQLQSALVLDDQLVQTDPQRMKWFSTVLREAAKAIQIVVLTCRPADYLVPNEFPSPDTPPSSGTLHAINLEHVAIRAG